MISTAPAPSRRSLLAATLAAVAFHVLALWAFAMALEREPATGSMPVTLVAVVSAQGAQVPALGGGPSPAQKSLAPEPMPTAEQPATMARRAEALATPDTPAAPMPVATGALAAGAAAPEPTPDTGMQVTGLAHGIAGAGPALGGGPATVTAKPLEPPVSDAAHLQNPRPPYPAASRRLGEQGRVVVRVLVGEDGTARKAQVQNSSGHHRLDQAALAAVMSWRFVPGKRAGIAAIGL